MSPAGASQHQLEARKEADALFTNNTILHLTLDISEESFKSLQRTPRKYVPATLRDGDTVYTNLAVHVKGGSGSLRKVDDRPGLTLHFGYLEPDGPRFHGLKKVHLNNGIQDPSRVSELVAGQVFRDAGVPAARTAHALLEFNGRKLGLYVIMESMNKDFLRQYFKNPEGDIYGQSRKGDVDDPLERMEGDAPLTRDGLKALADAVKEASPQRRLEKLEKTLDIDRFLSFMALEVIFGHWDGYTYARHNYRIYHDLDTGRMVFFPHDLDQLMNRPTAGLLPRPSGLVAQAMLNTPELRARYLQRVCSLATNLFVVSHLTNRVNQAVAALLPVVQASDAEAARSFSNFTSNYKTRIVNRRAKLERQFAILNGTAEPLRLTNDMVHLTEWTAENWQPATRMERAQDAECKQTLAILATRPVAASWHAQVLLEAGRYRFEAIARCVGIETTPRRKGGGASLTVLGYKRTESNSLSEDSSWQKLYCEFEVNATEDVDLACELRALKGQVWFDASSLQLVRVK